MNVTGYPALVADTSKGGIMPLRTLAIVVVAVLRFRSGGTAWARGWRDSNPQASTPHVTMRTL